MRSKMTRAALYPQIQFLQYDANAALSSASFTLSTSYQAGDFVYLIVNATNNGGGAPANQDIAGWTKLLYMSNLAYSTFFAALTSYCKILTASDPGSTINFANGNFNRGYASYCYRAQRPLRSFTVEQVQGQFTNDDPTQLVSTGLTSKAKPILAIGGAATETPLGTVTTNLESGDRRTDSASAYYADTIFINDKVLTEVNIDMVDSGNYNSLSLQYFTLQ